MFADLDETLRQLFIEYVPLDPSEVEVSFDTPDREWSGRLTRPAVNCFLYDVRENTRLRPSESRLRRDENNRMVGTKGPLRIDVTYLVTTWARAREDEHRLLARSLATLARVQVLPIELLKGELKEQPFPIVASVADPEHMPANFADLWQSLDNRIRPVLTYVVTLAVDPNVSITTPLVLKAPSVTVLAPNPAELAASLQNGTYVVRGRVRDRRDPTRAVAGALVVMLETGEQTLTGDDGFFTVGTAPRGPVTLIVRAADRPETTWPLRVPSPSFELEV